MSGFDELAREYEASRFPPSRRLDLHGEGPAAARERALHWIQSHAHEAPGEELLLVVERGRRPGRPASAIRREIEALLTDLEGRLVEWWQSFGSGSLALKLSHAPDLRAPARRPPATVGDGRTPETAGVGLLALHHDIPEALMELACRTAELRRVREEISVRMFDAVLRRVWIDAQALAMEHRLSFDAALRRIESEERCRALEGME